jgi:hypothetical protein
VGGASGSVHAGWCTQVCHASGSRHVRTRTLGGALTGACTRAALCQVVCAHWAQRSGRHVMVCAGRHMRGRRRAQAHVGLCVRTCARWGARCCTHRSSARVMWVGVSVARCGAWCRAVVGHTWLDARGDPTGQVVHKHIGRCDWAHRSVRGGWCTVVGACGQGGTGRVARWHTWAGAHRLGRGLGISSGGTCLGADSP